MNRIEKIFDFAHQSLKGGAFVNIELTDVSEEKFNELVKEVSKDSTLEKFIDEDSKVTSFSNGKLTIKLK